MAPSNFKVIVVGGGPIGIITAHCLSKSNIDYVVFEKGAEVAPLNGSGHMLFPNTLRFLDQIGILSQVAPAGQPVHTKQNFLKDGTSHGEIDLGQFCVDNHGYNAIYFQRSHLIGALYEALPAAEKSKIRTNSKVSDVEVTETGVRVTLTDGKVEEGSIVIGCDGVYSQIRQKALDLANASGKGKKLNGLPYKSTIRCYCFRLDWPSPDKEKCLMWETRSNGLAAQGFAQKESLIVALFEHLDKPSEGYNRFSEEEKEAFKQKFVDIHLNDELKVGDVMHNDKINWDFFADQEEGRSDIVQYGGRIVLAGDSVHKITPISGLGLNMGIQQSIALVNRLNTVLSAEVSPSAATLEEAFKQYEKDLSKTLGKVLELNTILGDGVTWANWPAWFIDRVAAPWIGLKFIITKFYSNDIIRHGLVLNNLPKNGLKAGQIAWVS